MTVTSFWRLNTPPTDILTQQVSSHPEYAALDPKDMHRGQFEQLTRAEQIAYIEKWGTGPNKEVTIQSASAMAHGGTTVRLSLKTDAGGVQQVVGSVDDRVLDPTPGELLPDDQRRPYHELPGSPGGGALSKAGADALFPKLDGINGTIQGPKPDGWTELPASGASQATIGAFLAKFATWHSAHQAEFIKEKGDVAGTAPNLVSTLQLGTGSTVYAVAVSHTSGKIYHFASLTKQDIAAIPANDFTALKTVTAFTNRLAEIGLVDSATVKALLSAAISNAVLDLATSNGGANAGTIHVQYAKPFKDQLVLLNDSIATGSFVDSKEIEKKMKDVQDRFTRMKEFYNSYHRDPELPNQSYAGASIRTNVVSTDGMKAIREGLETFVRQEEKIAASARRRDELVRGTTTLDGSLANGVRYVTGPGGKPLDLPTLIFALQSEYNVKKEAEVASDTEVVRQYNELLKAYSIMQASVNTTIGAFSKDDMDKQNRKEIEHVSGIGIKTHLEKDDAKARTWEMFNDQHFKEHPLEKLSGNRRPTFMIFIDQNVLNGFLPHAVTGRVHSPNAWQQYQTTLSERVNSLNQDSQVRMNEINNKDKERNRHFDQANNALQKMNDALQSILRAG